MSLTGILIAAGVGENRGVRFAVDNGDGIWHRDPCMGDLVAIGCQCTRCGNHDREVQAVGLWNWMDLSALKIANFGEQIACP